MQTKYQAISHLQACGDGYKNMTLQEDESGVLCGTHANGLPARIAGSNEIGWFEVHGGICSVWVLLGGPASALGHPVSNEEDDPYYRNPNGKRSRFQHGTIHGWPASNGEWNFAIEEIHPSQSDLLIPEPLLRMKSWLAEYIEKAGNMLPSSAAIREQLSKVLDDPLVDLVCNLISLILETNPVSRMAALVQVISGLKKVSDQYNIPIKDVISYVINRLNSMTGEAPLLTM